MQQREEQIELCRPLGVGFVFSWGGDAPTQILQSRVECHYRLSTRFCKRKTAAAANAAAEGSGKHYGEQKKKRRTEGK